MGSSGRPIAVVLGIPLHSLQLGRLRRETPDYSSLSAQTTPQRGVRICPIGKWGRAIGCVARISTQDHREVRGAIANSVWLEEIIDCADEAARRQLTLRAG